MPDFRYTGTLRIESNDPATPREIELQAVQSSFIVPVEFTSYEGAVEIHGITELANVSDPPRKYQNLIPDNAGFLRQETDPGPAQLSPLFYWAQNRTSVNDADVKYQQINLSNYTCGKGGNFLAPAYTTVPAGTPWWMFLPGGGCSSGGANYDSMEVLPAPGLAFYGWEDGTNWFKLPFTKDKRFKELKAPDGFDRDPVEFATSPKIVQFSRTIGSTTDSNARFTIRMSAQRGNAGFWNIYIVWAMGQYAIGSGPLARVWLQARQGNQPVVADTTGALMGNLVAGPGSGQVFFFRNFRLPDDCSFRFFGSVVGSPLNEYQFPQDWASVEARITDEALGEVDHDTWFYCDPNLPVGTLMRSETYREVLVNEDPIPAALIADGGTVVATDQWAKTVGISGGIAPESYDPISFEGRTVKATFTMFGLTPLQVYTVGLTYEQVQTGTTTRTYIQDSIDVYPGLNNFADVEIDIVAPLGFQRRLYATSITGVAPEPPAGDGVDRVFELLAQGSAAAAGATYTAGEKAAIDGFLAELSGKAYRSVIKYVMPFFGNDVVTQIQPILDTSFFGPPTNTNFVDADGSTINGLKGDGASKRLTMPFRYNNLGGLTRFGCGVWVNDWDNSGTAGGNINRVWNLAPNQVYGLSIGNTNLDFNAGQFANIARFVATGTDNTHYYGQKTNDTSRKIFRTGLLLDEDTTNDTSSDMGYDFVPLFGDNLGGPRYSAFSLHVAYFTDGGLTDAQVLDFHNLIETYLITAVGR